MVRSALPAIVLAAASLTGCGSTERLPPGGIAGLDGRYEGAAVLTWGQTRCAERTPYAFTVRNGTVFGEIFNPRNPAVPVGRFETYVDSEGRISTNARAAGDEVVIEGAFERDRFVGTTQSDTCRNRLTLTRR